MSKKRSFKENTKIEKKTKEERIGKQMPHSSKNLGSSGKNPTSMFLILAKVSQIAVEPL